MTLRFFRKHRKLGIILLISAVFAMVTFSVLFKLPDALQQMFGDPGHQKVAVMEVYGKKISRLTAQQVRERLAPTGQLNVWIYRSLMEATYGKSEHRDEARRAFSAMATFASPLPVVYFESSEAEREKVVEATLILLTKAEQAGMKADDGAGEEVLRQWRGAGIPDQLIASLRMQIFGGSEELMRKSLAQDLVLSSYINLKASCGLVSKEEVAAEFRSENDKAEIKEVTLPFGDFIKAAADPTEAEIKAQFEKYRDVVAGTDQPFGYKVPNRIKVAYVSGAESDFEPMVTVSNSEIQAYYEEYKDKYYTLTGSQSLLGQSVENLLSGAAATVPSGAGASKSGSGTKLNVPSALPAKVLNAPDFSASSAARATVATAVAARSANVASSAKAGEVASGLATPSVRYKPLAVVREDIERKLRKEKAAEACYMKIREAYVKLSQKPTLGLENVADGKLLKIHNSETFVTEEQAGELPGIGRAKGAAGNERQERQYGKSVPFAVLAFAIKPFSADPVIHLDRVVGPLVNEYENSFLFKVTAVEPGHTPAELADVRSLVIADLKKKAAYALAMKAGEALKAAAEKEGLAAAAKAEKLTVDKPESVGRDEAGSGKLSSPHCRAVFAVADSNKTGKKIGLVGSETFDAVQVFEVEKVTHGTAAEFEQSRSTLVEAAQRQAWGKMLPNTIKSLEDLVRQSGAKMLEPIDFRETKKEAPSSDTGVEMPPGT